MDVMRPRFRGLVHAWSAGPALAAAIVLLCLAPTGQARVAVAIYGAGLVALFSISGLYHRWPPTSGVKVILQRLDHCTIFFFIAASYTPPTVLLLSGTKQTDVLVSVWGGALAGVLLRVVWIQAPRGAGRLLHRPGLGRDPRPPSSPAPASPPVCSSSSAASSTRSARWSTPRSAPTRGR